MFRFVNIRPVFSELPSEDKMRTGISAFSDTRPSAFFKELRKGKQDRAGYEELAARYIASDSYALGPVPLPLKLSELDRTLSQQGTSSYSTSFFLERIRRISSMDLPALLQSESFAQSKERVSDSVLASIISPSIPDAQKRILIRMMRLIAVINRLASWKGDITEEQISDISILLPDDVFPLPPAQNMNEKELEKEIDTIRKKIAEWEKSRDVILTRIENNKLTLDELQRAYRMDLLDMKKDHARNPTFTAPAARAGGPSRSSRRPSKEEVDTTVHFNGKAQPLISAKRISTMSTTTKKSLEDIGIAKDFVDLVETTGLIERELARDSASLYIKNKKASIVLLGDRWVPTSEPAVTSSGFDSIRHPGMCSLSFTEPVGSRSTTVPGSTTSSIRPIGIADLHQVRQKVKYYAAGEIAQIANILKGESNKKTVRDLAKVTETNETESESTFEESRETQSSDRFELQKESAKVIQEDTSREIGVTVSASYGPTVSATANFKYTNTKSRQDNNKRVTRYSKEISDRAVKRIQERTLERRSITTHTEHEVIVKHSLSNVEGQKHVQGIYRWVDKVCEAHVVSYGLRMMFEFVVPEPASFYRFALGAAPPEGMHLEKPEPPGYCVKPGDSFMPMSPSDLDESNYLFWLSKYEVKDGQPPPSRYKLIGTSASGQSQNGTSSFGTTNTQLEVPSGYQARQVWLTGSVGWTMDENQQLPEHRALDIVVGRAYMVVGALGTRTNSTMNGEEGTMPIAIMGSKVSIYAVTIEVLCERTKEAFEAWQIETHNLIMAAYNEKKAHFESELVKGQTLAANLAVGRNPQLNREIERTELKRAAISIFTGQHFDDFDSTRRLADGRPQFSIAEARAEGGYIQFFEQAFEWINMTYRLYPYFWGRKTEWPALINADDLDPTFAKFLQAGAARIQVPVRPGFELAIHNFLLGQKPWEEEDAFEIDGSLYSSIIDEIKEEQRGAFTKGKGTISVTDGKTHVTGTDTEFEDKLHTNREIYIQDRLFIVKEVISSTELVLETPYKGPTESELPYTFGAKKVGDPWEVRLPTSFLYLQNSDELPQLDSS